MANWNNFAKTTEQTAARSRAKPVAAIAFAFLATGVLCGCGRSGPERAVVSGTVTYLGRPLAQGAIRFLPTGETKTPMSGALIVDGKYLADKRGGVPVGTHQVVIEAFRPIHGAGTGGDAPASGAPASGSGLVPREQYLPARYNSQSELEITIEPGAGQLERNFELTGPGR